MHRGVKPGLMIAGGVIASLLVIVVVGVLVITQTDWGRERVRRAAIGRLALMVNGKVTIGRIEGNVLKGATLIDVAITDSADAPFLKADTIKLSYSVRTLYAQHLIFKDVYVAHPVVLVDRQPGGDWNFNKLFSSGPDNPADTIPGFGSWVRFDGLRIRGGDVTVRDQWNPADSLKGNARDSAIAYALSDESRRLVVRVPGGYQAVSQFKEVNATLPLVRWADPDSANRMFHVSSANMTAFAFRPPPALVRDMKGTIVVSKDSAFFNQMAVTLPASTLNIEGYYSITGNGDFGLDVKSSDLAFEDLRFIRPSLPDGGGSVDASITNPNDRYHFVARSMDLRAEGAHASGSIDVLLSDPPRLGASDIAFTGFDTRLMRRFTDAVPPALDGIANGSLKLAGTTESLSVDGWTSFRERSGTLSGVIADGRIGNDAAGSLETDNLRLRFQPLSVSLVKAFSPENIKFGGMINGNATLTGSTRSGFDIIADVTHAEGRGARSHVLADGEVSFGNGVALRNMRLRFDPLQVAIIKAYQPTLAMDGTLDGRATLTGSMTNGFDVDADVIHNQAGIGRSHILADGGVRFGNGLIARNLKLQFDPMQVALVKLFRPTLPLDGTLAGRATLNGPVQTDVRAAIDITHTAETGTSQAIGNVAFTAGTVPRFNVDLRTPVLALATAGRFVPSAGLRGTAHGRIAAKGTLDNFALDTDLSIDNGGRAQVTGNFDLQSAAKKYDFTGVFSSFDAAAVTARAPVTLLNGTLTATGVGTDPATARAVVRADLVDLQLAGAPSIDTTRVHMRFENGLATAEKGHIRLGSTSADFEGSFGLVEGRTGELRYRVALDSLAQYRQLIPITDSAFIAPRPLTQARIIALARADSARIFRETEVERTATGKPPEPTLKYDTIAPVRADSISGSIRAEGVLVGNIKKFDTRGNAVIDHATVSGHSAARGRIAYNLTGFMSPGATYDVSASFDSLRAFGFAFDSSSLKLQFEGVRKNGNGTAQVAIFQDNNRDYSLDTQFRLELDRKELLLNRVALRLDTMMWTSTHAGAVRWAGDGFQIDNIELASNVGGRVYANGRIPQKGVADLSLELERVQIGNVTALLQDTTQMSGMVSLNARLQGTREDPRIAGTATVDSASYGGKPLPDAKVAFDYANTELKTQIELLRGSMRLASADATLPINLALTGVTGPRLIDNRELSAEIQADSLPLDALPSLTGAIDQIRGRLRGNVKIAGTWKDARVEGLAALDLGSLRVVRAGVRYQHINGAIRFAGDTAYVDSIHARAGAGTIRVNGTIAMKELLKPGFNLAMNAHRAQLINNDMGRINGDAQIRLTGSLGEPQIDGTIRIRGGVAYAPEMDHRRATNLDLPTVAQVADTSLISPTLVARPNPFIQNLRLDVAVDVDRNTWVRNAKANAEVYTPPGEPLRIRMSQGRNTLTIAGSVNAERGEYAYAGRTFQLTTGTATFLEGAVDLDPLIQLNGQYLVQRPNREALVIQINVSGAMRKPTVSLESNSQPPLSQSQLLSLFAFGQSSASLLNLQGSGLAGGSGLTGITAVAQQQLTGLAIGAVTEQAVADVQREGTRAGLDVFRIHTSALPDELGFDSYFQNMLKSTEIIAGKYISPRLFVAAQGNTTALPGLRAEYRTPGGFSLESSWERRYVPSEPTLDERQAAKESRNFGLFLFWTRRF